MIYASLLQEKCKILKIGNYFGAETGVSFYGASRELLPTRCGGSAGKENLKKRKLFFHIISIYQNFSLTLRPQSCEQRTFAEKSINSPICSDRPRLARAFFLLFFGKISRILHFFCKRFGSFRKKCYLCSAIR